MILFGGMGEITGHTLPPVKPPNYTRRQFIRDGVRVGAAVALVRLIQACIPQNNAEHPPLLPDSPLQLGKEESQELPGLQWYPDGHISVLEDDGVTQAWIAAGRETYRLSGQSLDTLGNPEVVLQPTYETGEKGFNGYRGFGSVIRGRTPDERIGFYHNEWHPNQTQTFPFTSEIGIVVSTDNGLSWVDKGIVVRGPHSPRPSGDVQRPFGAGQPSAIQIGDYIHLYYTGWNPDSADAVYAACAPLIDVDNLQSWRLLADGTFSARAIDGVGTPVVSRPTEDHSYAAIPGVSWNTHLNKYVMVFESGKGFLVTTSQDGISWDTGKLVFSFPPENSNHWYRYPTLLSPKKDHTITDKIGWLYYGKGEKGRSQSMARMPFTFVS